MLGFHLTRDQPLSPKPLSPRNSHESARVQLSPQKHNKAPGPEDWTSSIFPRVCGAPETCPQGLVQLLTLVRVDDFQAGICLPCVSQFPYNGRQEAQSSSQPFLRSKVALCTECTTLGKSFNLIRVHLFILYNEL